MASFAALCVQGVAVKPDNADVILQCVGTSDYSSDPLRGVWRSADGGSTWTHVLTGKNFSGNDQERFGGECVAFHPQNANEVWVGTRGQGVFRSMDGGSNWLQVNGPDGRVTSINLPPSGRSDIWIGSSDRPLTVSVNSGATWTSLTASSGATAALSMQWRVVRQPNGRVLVSGRNPSGPRLAEYDSPAWINPAVYSWSGITWPAKSAWMDCPLVAALPDGRIIAGSIWGGGSWGASGPDNPRTQIRSTGGTWSDIDSLSGAMPLWQRSPGPTVIEGGRTTLLVDPSDATRWFLSGGYAPFRTTNAGASWQYSFNGLNEVVSFKVRFDAGDATKAYLPMGDHGGAVITGLDGAVPAISTYITTPKLSYPEDLAIGHAMWRQGGQIIALGGDQRTTNARIFASLDAGATWSVKVADLPAMPNQQIMAALPIKGSDTVFLAAMGGTAGRLYRTTNGGDSFYTPSGLPAADFGNGFWPLIDLAADGVDANICYAFIHNHGLYKSTTAGQYWTQVAGVPADQGFIEADATLANVLWRGGYFPGGLYRSANGGGARRCTAVRPGVPAIFPRDAPAARSVPTTTARLPTTAARSVPRTATRLRTAAAAGRSARRARGR